MNCPDMSWSQLHGHRFHYNYPLHFYLSCSCSRTWQSEALGLSSWWWLWTTTRRSATKLLCFFTPCLRRPGMRWPRATWLIFWIEVSKPLFLLFPGLASCLLHPLRMFALVLPGQGFSVNCVFVCLTILMTYHSIGFHESCHWKHSLPCLS